MDERLAFAKQFKLNHIKKNYNRKFSTTVRELI